MQAYKKKISQGQCSHFFGLIPDLFWSLVLVIGRPHRFCFFFLNGVFLFCSLWETIVGMILIRTERCGKSSFYILGFRILQQKIRWAWSNMASRAVRQVICFSMKAQRRDGFAHAFDQSWNLQRKQIPPQKWTSWWHSSELFCEKISSQKTENLLRNLSQFLPGENCHNFFAVQKTMKWTQKNKPAEQDVFFFSPGFFSRSSFPAQYSNDQNSAAKATQLTKMWENCQETLQKEALKKIKTQKTMIITWVRTLEVHTRGQGGNAFCVQWKSANLGVMKQVRVSIFRQAKGKRGSVIYWVIYKLCKLCSEYRVLPIIFVWTYLFDTDAGFPQA